MPEQAFADLASLCDVRKASRGAPLFSEGQPGEGLFVIRTGEVKLTKSGRDGREQILYLARPGRAVVEGIRFDGGAYPASAVAMRAASAYLVTKAVVPYMGDGGSIVNFASLAGRDGGGPGAWAYASAKGAVMTLTRGLAKELGPKKIRVNALCPGMISTTFHDVFTKDQVRANVANATPLRREGAASEVADAVAYLASDEASFLTGVNLDINGGLFFS